MTTQLINTLLAFIAGPAPQAGSYQISPAFLERHAKLIVQQESTIKSVRKYVAEQRRNGNNSESVSRLEASADTTQKTLDKHRASLMLRWYNERFRSASPVQ